MHDVKNNLFLVVKIELSLTRQIRLNSSNSLYKAFIYEVHLLSLRSNVEVT